MYTRGIERGPKTEDYLFAFNSPAKTLRKTDDTAQCTAASAVVVETNLKICVMKLMQNSSKINLYFFPVPNGKIKFLVSKLLTDNYVQFL